MTNKKKKYLAPEMKVIEIEQADIICTSGTIVYSDGTFKTIEEGENTVWGIPTGW